VHDNYTEPQEPQWHWGSSSELLNFIDDLDADELLEISYAPASVITAEPIDPADDLCRFRRQPRAGGGIPYLRRWVVQMHRDFHATSADIANLPTAEGDSYDH
jgi:hypothetical protein